MIVKRSNNEFVGIIMAGGSGSRLYPNTRATNKHLISIYDKPMIYYSLSLIFLANIRNIIFICSDEDISKYKKLFGNGKNFGVSIRYLKQNIPRGIAEGILIAKKFIANKNILLVLGDNIIYGSNFRKVILNAKKKIKKNNSIIFGCFTNNPNNFGVLKLNPKNNKLIEIIEKPKEFVSNYAVPGIYFYGSDVIKYAKQLSFSARKELEITDLNNLYLKNKKLECRLFNRGISWLDSGSPEGLLDASNFVRAIEKTSGMKIACLEEISLINKWISKKQIESLINRLKINSNYIEYLNKLIEK